MHISLVTAFHMYNSRFKATAKLLVDDQSIKFKSKNYIIIKIQNIKFTKKIYLQKSSNSSGASRIRSGDV